jgi:hypothetical protein
MAICNIALHLSREGRYADAESITKFAASQYAFQQHSQMWKMTDLHVTFYRTLWLGQWDKAELIVSQLAVFDRAESQAKKAHLMLCKGDTSQGKFVLNALEEKLSNTKESSNHRMPNPGWKMGQKLRLQVQCLMLRAVLLSARQNFVEALLQISQASDICTKHHMSLELALVGMQSAEIQVLFQILISWYNHGTNVFSVSFLPFIDEFYRQRAGSSPQTPQHHLHAWIIIRAGCCNIFTG